MSADLATLDTSAAAAYVRGEGYDYDQAIARAADAWEAMRRSAMAFGLHILAIKEREPHGRYIAALAAIGVSRPTAYRLRTRAAWLLEHNVANGSALNHLPEPKLLDHQSANTTALSDLTDQDNPHQEPPPDIATLADLSGEQLDLLIKYGSPQWLPKLWDPKTGQLLGRPITAACALTTKDFKNEVIARLQTAPSSPQPPKEPYVSVYARWIGLNKQQQDRFLQMIHEDQMDHELHYRVEPRT